MKILIKIFYLSFILFFSINTLKSQVDCGGVAVPTFNIFNCGVGQSPQLSITVQVCGTQQTQGNWTISYPGGNNTISFFVQNNCPANFNCGVSGQTISFPNNFNCGSVLLSNVVVTNAAGQTCIVQSAANCAALPLDFLSFEIENNGNQNILKWKTANEVNVDYIVIQNSQDGINFVDVDIVKSQNEISQLVKEYSYEHSFDHKINYYRLKSVDFDKTETFSKILLMENSFLNSVFSVYPNPVRDILNLPLNAIDANSEVKIYDNLGKLRLVTTEKEIKVSDLSTGLYIIKASKGSKIITSNFLKL